VAAGTFLLQRHHWQRFWRTRDSHVVVQSNSAALATLLEGLPPTRPLVASDPTTSTLLPAARHCSVVASLLIHANPADAGLRERHRRLVELLAPATDAVQRGELLRELAPDYLIVPLEPPKRRPTMDEEDDVELTEIAPPSAFETCCERLRTAGPYVLMRPRRELR